jgi:phosphatidylserine/phosphatidylglycerophosphate/cardiolipin synthase-like enzyme
VIEEFRKRIGSRKLTGSLMIAPIRFRHGIDAWEVEGEKIKVTTHAKLWMIDERTFHLGSDNIYPHNLQEFGYVIEDPEVAAGLLRSYWNPLWENSSPGALHLTGS